MQEIIGYVSIAYMGGSFRAHTGTAASEMGKEEGFFLEGFEGLLEGGAVNESSIRRYGYHGSIIPPAKHRSGKVIDITLLFVGNSREEVRDAVDTLREMEQSNRLILDTDWSQVGPYTAIAQEGTNTFEWLDAYTFSYSCIFKAQEAF